MRISFWIWAGSKYVLQPISFHKMISQAFSPTTATWQLQANVSSFSRSLIEVLGNPGLEHWFFSFFFPLSIFFLFLLQFCRLWLRLVSKWKTLPSVTDCSKTTTVELPRSINYLTNTWGVGCYLRQQFSNSFLPLNSHCIYLYISCQYQSFSSLLTSTIYWVLTLFYFNFHSNFVR